MPLADVETRLRAAGIIVTRTRRGLALGAAETPGGGWTDGSCIIAVAGKWLFESRHGVPGMVAEDVLHTLGDLESAIEFAIQWNTAPPVVMSGWIVPLNRHPEWDAARVAACIAAARTVSRADFRAVVTDASARRSSLDKAGRAGQTVTLETMYTIMFALFRRPDGSESPVLCPRRDLAEAYIVAVGDGPQVA